MLSTRHSISNRCWAMCGSVRVNQQYRAMPRRKGSLVVWFWIGSHGDYDELIKRLR